MEERFH